MLPDAVREPGSPARGRVRRVLERVVERRRAPTRSRSSAVAVSKSANHAFLGSSGPCR